MQSLVSVRISIAICTIHTTSCSIISIHCANNLRRYLKGTVIAIAPALFSFIFCMPTGSTTTLLGWRGAESLEAAKDRHVTRLGLTMIAGASHNLGKVFFRNISLILSRSPRPVASSLARVWGHFPRDTRVCEYHLLGNTMALGNSKQLYHQTSYYPVRGLKLFLRTCSTITRNIIRNDWRTALQAPLECSTKFRIHSTHRWA